MSTQLDIALRYAAADFSLMPIRADGSKQPDAAVLPLYYDEIEKRQKRGWTPLQLRQQTREELHTWYGNGTPRGIGLIHGRVSRNSEVLDFDQPGLYEEFEALADETGHGDLVRSLPRIKTPSGGDHLPYRCTEPPEGNQKLAERAVEVPEGTQGARLIAGKSSSEFQRLLGFTGEPELIHRDNFVLS